MTEITDCRHYVSLTSSLLLSFLNYLRKMRGIFFFIGLAVIINAARFVFYHIEVSPFFDDREQMRLFKTFLSKRVLFTFEP